MHGQHPHNELVGQSECSIDSGGILCEYCSTVVILLGLPVAVGTGDPYIVATVNAKDQALRAVVPPESACSPPLRGCPECQWNISEVHTLLLVGEISRSFAKPVRTRSSVRGRDLIYLPRCGEQLRRDQRNSSQYCGRRVFNTEDSVGKRSFVVGRSESFVPITHDGCPWTIEVRYRRVKM